MYAPKEKKMARISGTVNRAKILMSGALRTLPELKPESRPQTLPCPAITKQPNANHIASKTHIHFAAELCQVRHMKKPIKTAQTTLKMIIFHCFFARSATP